MKLMQYMYKYILHKKSTKHICPSCLKKRLVRYIDIETNNYVSPKVGRCDREINCGYHYPPKKYFLDTNQDYESLVSKSVPSYSIQKNSDYHSTKALNKTLINYNKNNFIQFLKTKFEIKIVDQMVLDYKIGTALNNYFGTVFWQVDNENNIRGGKIINYDKRGKRTKYINWIHSIQIKNKEISEFNLSQCLFGLHLTNRSNKVIAIVESEKTACIMSMLFQKYEWMAAGSLNGLSEKKIKSIKHRKITLYPDLGIDNGHGTPFDQWYNKSISLNMIGFDIKVSDLLERKSNDLDREKGLDIADYFIIQTRKKTVRVKSKRDELFLKLYMKNKNLKTLVELFELENKDGTRIKFE